MSNPEVFYDNISDTFGVEIKHTIEGPEATIDLSEDASARESLEQLEARENTEAIYNLTHAVDEVSRVVQITRQTDQDTEELIDIFTAPQILEMGQRIHDYLGQDVEDHIRDGGRPPGYQFFIDRLGMYVRGDDHSVTSSFNAFEKRHTDPVPRAKGPYEQNSRQYAMQANHMIIKSLDNFYQADFDVQLIGPTQVVDSSNTWRRGIAESQFLVLDYVAVQAAQGFEHKIRLPKSEIAMTLDDIAANITSLLTQRRLILDRTNRINPLIAEQIDLAIGSLNELTLEAIHRGRWDARRYEREPKRAQRDILHIASLLVQAASLDQVEGQEDIIPISDLDSLSGE